ncbi:hypothetical protein VCSRO55_3540 [Vibrio cholerae]|uniref:hypothetical protein n=1 Tax=Vibrio cholerae TaxID=666 RepID=UPI0011D64FCB|nr:hypothetical protein [Vibrio cholerae]EGR2498602.1 hypothetical protein [Vibrio cholerae]TXZ56487.1 hypothetical protein FXE54_04225 [Vibrio cholerae]GHW30694.1 hypothetical protein VCSRO55_3540 [Vibrio cholerae]
MKSDWFDPHKSFLSLRVVWVAVFVLTFISVTSASIIIFNSELEVDLSFHGFNLFISVFRFPLAIAALIIPIIALLAANHRSEQTKEQIRVTNAQNVFSNYYKHIEEFTKYLLNRVDKNVDLRFAHSNVYPEASNGDYSINVQLISLLKELDGLPAEILQCRPSDLNEKLMPELREKHYKLLHEIYRFFYRERDDYSSYITYRKPTNYGDTYLFESSALIEHCQKAIFNAEIFCKFSIDYVSVSTGLDSNVLDMSKVYVFNKPPSQSGLELLGQKKEQTFEEANEVFIAMLQQSLEVD